MAGAVPAGAGELWRLDSDPAGWGELPLTYTGDSPSFCTRSGVSSGDLTAPPSAPEEESEPPDAPEALGAKAQETRGWGTMGVSHPLGPLPHSPPPYTNLTASG